MPPKPSSTGEAVGVSLLPVPYSLVSPYAAPTSKIGVVGVSEPSARSTVTPNALAGTPAGSGGKIKLALPVESGWNNPAGMGAFPLAGITHSS